MSEVRKLGRDAIADFLRAMGRQRAHWYAILTPNDACQLDRRHSLAFPSFSKLTSVDEEIIRVLFRHCGLVQYRSNTGYSVMDMAWADFIREYYLEEEVEVSHLFLLRRRRIYVRLGSWQCGIKKTTPQEIWNRAKKDEVFAPKLRITCLSNEFAKNIGALGILVPDDVVGNESDNSSTDSASDDENLAESKACEEGEAEAGEVGLDLPDPNEFPLLHSLFITHCTSDIMDRLLKEVIRFNGSNTLNYQKGNNTKGTLINLPSYRSLKNYSKDLMKSTSPVAAIVNFIVENAKCSADEATDCLISAFSKLYPQNFVAVSSGLEKQMDEVRVEAMLCDAGISDNKARKLFSHMRTFFGRSLFVSEQKRRRYFGNIDFPPIVDKMELADKTIVNYWWKRPDRLLENQLNHITDSNRLRCLASVDFATGGDHGGGRFRMLFKIIFRFVDGSSTTHLYEIANVSHSKDDINILKEAVLEKIGVGLRRIAEGCHFIVTCTEDEKLLLRFDESEEQEGQLLCNVPCQLFVNGDLKYFAQLLGRDGMSSSWCMWCQSHPSEWKNNRPTENLWTMALQHEFYHRKARGELKEPKDIKGIVSLPVFDFVEPSHYIFPLLHFEIGAVNNLLDNFRAFVEDEIEVVSDEEKTARNRVIIADVSHTKAKQLIDQWNSDGGSIELRAYRVEKAQVTAMLRHQGLPRDEIQSLKVQKDELDATIEVLNAQQKLLEKDVSAKRAVLSEAKKALKKIQSGKKKVDFPVVATIENLFEKYEIKPAAYHGGKLNGVDCREVMAQACKLFADIQTFLLTIVHPDRCNDDVIISTCKLHQDIAATLDTITAKMRLKRGQPQPEDFQILRRALHNLDYLWTQVGLSYTPKIHGMLCHAYTQMEQLGGFGDLLEDDLEHLHQTSKRISDRTSRIKSRTQQAISHSKIEAKQNHVEVRGANMKHKLESKREFKVARKADAISRGVEAKAEREEKRMNTLAAVEQKQHLRHLTFHEKEKLRLLNLS